MGGRFRPSLLGVLISAALGLLAVAAPARAQYNASIQGTVVDKSGAVVAGANVTIKNEATGVTQSTTSTTTGFYAISGLPPGSYDVTVSATNFQTNQISGVVVRAEQVRGLDITLQLGQITQKVTVNGAEQPALQTEDANIVGTLSSREIQALPKFNRDPYELVRLSPGVFGDGAR
ncbi:MAG: carboxypeptidase-like regulatory domain-containing protein, partial [Rhizomicrobium sp.]